MNPDPKAIIKANKELMVEELQKEDTKYAIVKHLLKATTQLYNTYIREEEDENT